LGANSDARNGLIYIDNNNFWDFINKKFRIGTPDKYIYFDSSDIYFKSVDIELTTADLITYNADKSKRYRHTELQSAWEGGTNYGENLGKIYYDETASELKGKLNNLEVRKGLLVGSDYTGGNWITSRTPVLEELTSTNTNYRYIVIDTGIIAYGYTDGGVSMFDVTMQSWTLSGNSVYPQQLIVRWSGYIYTDKTIRAKQCHITNSGVVTDMHGGAYVDIPSGHLHLYLYSYSLGQQLSAYYRYIRVWYDGLNYAKKSYHDSWNAHYIDSITRYDTNYGMVNFSTYGDTYSTGYYAVCSASLSGGSSYIRYFTLIKDCWVRVTSSSAPTYSFFALTSSSNVPIYGYDVSRDNADNAVFLTKGKYYYRVYFSGTTSTTITLYALRINGFAPSGVWSQAEICPDGFTTT